MHGRFRAETPEAAHVRRVQLCGVRYDVEMYSFSITTEENRGKKRLLDTALFEFYTQIYGRVRHAVLISLNGWLPHTRI